MKKTLFTLASIALLASCQQGEILVDTTETPEAPRRIGFETFVNKSTRAGNSTALNDFYPTFNVYGWKVVGEDTACVFENIPVSYYDGMSATKPSIEWGEAPVEGWYYQDVRYWDQMATSYQFSAYAPATATNDVECTADGIITIGTATDPITVDPMNLMDTPATDLAYTGFDFDYMTAQSAVEASPVELEFKHLQAKFNVRIRKDAAISTAQNVAVQTIRIHNLAGTGYYTNESPAPAGAVDGWSTCDNPTPYVPAVNTPYSLNAAANYHDYYVLEQLIIPQTIEKPAAGVAVPSIDEYAQACIYVEYTIGTELFKSYTPLVNIFSSDANAETYTFKAGNQYTININVGPKPIYFTTSVSAWEEGANEDLDLD